MICEECRTRVEDGSCACGLNRVDMRASRKHRDEWIDITAFGEQWITEINARTGEIRGGNPYQEKLNG